MNVLFVCGKARMRSPTAADIVSKWDGFAADFAGLSKDADEQLSSEQVDWADVIMVMDSRQKRKLAQTCPNHLHDKRVVELNVPDRFAYMDEALVALLESKVRRVLQA